MKIEQNISLHDKNWFRTGGCARYFCEPTTEQEFADALAFAREYKLDICMLGEGANVLVSDEGFDGLVIRPQLTALTINERESQVTAGAGVAIQDLINFCLDHCLLGLEEFSAIPGTVGGSAYINIHYFQFFLSHYLVKARVINRQTGHISDVDTAWFHFGYDQSALFDKQHYVVNATFALKQGDALDAAYAKGRRDEIIRHRKARYPYANTCGSFFRNFLPEEVSYEVNGKKIPFVAYYLDKIGVKGALRVGNAAVSHQHANMLVTSVGATSRDVIELAKSMQRMVHEQFGMTPHAECQFIGFKENPLL